MSFLKIGALFLKGASKSSIVKKYGKVAVDKFIKRYSKDQGLQLSKDFAVGLPTMAVLGAISDKRNYKNKTKPKKEKYHPRLGGKKSKNLAKKYFKGTF